MAVDCFGFIARMDSLCQAVVPTMPITARPTPAWASMVP